MFIKTSSRWDVEKLIYDANVINQSGHFKYLEWLSAMEEGEEAAYKNHRGRLLMSKEFSIDIEEKRVESRIYVLIKVS